MSTDPKLKQLRCLITKWYRRERWRSHYRTETETLVTLHVFQKSNTGTWKSTKFRTRLQEDAILTRTDQEADRLDGCLVLLWNLLVHVAASATDSHVPRLQLR